MVLSVALALLTTAAPDPADTRLDDGYALTLSGGVSLGSYEAGLNWALVRVFQAGMGEMLIRRRPRLVGVTGASAGSINALLVAALYCETEESAARSSIDDNLLRSAWLEVGLDSLLPGDPRSYLPDDAVLASAALMPVVDQVRHALIQGGMAFRPRCRLPVGLTVTRVSPARAGRGRDPGHVAAGDAAASLRRRRRREGALRARSPSHPRSMLPRAGSRWPTSPRWVGWACTRRWCSSRSWRRRRSPWPSDRACSASARPTAGRTRRPPTECVRDRRALRSPACRARRTPRPRADDR